MVRCVYRNCLNNKSYVNNKKSFTSGSKVTFFSFPAAIEQCKKWVFLCSENFQNKNISLEKLFKNKTFKICEKHFKKEDFVNDYNGDGRKFLRKQAKPQSLTESLLASTSSVRQVVVSSAISCLLPMLNVITSDIIDGPSNNENNDNHITSTIDEHEPKTEESLKRLNSLIKELEDTNAALNQGINIAEVDLVTHSHIKKEVNETAILTFEDIIAEDRVTNHDCKSRKGIKNPNIFTYEEITSEDMTDINGTLISKQSEVLNNSFEQKHRSLDIDKEIKLEIIDDEDKFKSIPEQIYTFSGITSGDDCERKYEFGKINPFLKREIENNVKFEKIKDESLMWDEVNTEDDRNLSDYLDIKEVKCENVLSEVDIKIEEIFGGEETISSPIPLKCDYTYRDIPFLTHQISKQNNLLTSENNLGKSFYGSRPVSRKENQISKIGSYEPSATCEISYNRNVYPITQAATDMETKSFERPISDRFSLFNSSANDNKNNLVHKVSNKNIDKWNAGITSSISRKAIDPYKKCLAISVDKNIVFIKLKPFKRKKRTLV